MKQQIFLVFPIILCTMAIKVPVDNREENVSGEDTEVKINQNQNKPIYYTTDEAIDSYLIPPNPHTAEEVLPDTIVTPATYLLPPSADKQVAYYYAPTESGEQSDWYPIAQQTVPQKQPDQLLPPKLQSATIPIFLSNANETNPLKINQNPRSGKVLGDRFIVPIPSINLEPPAEDAPNDYTIQIPSEELELPAEEIDHQYDIPKVPSKANYKDGHYRGNSEQPIASHLLPPKHFLRKYKTPTKIYPKKYNGSFKPVPIPIAQFADDSLSEVPRAKPVKYFRPLPSIEGVSLSPIDEKKIYQYELADQKKKLKGEESQEQQEESAEKYVPVPPTEQDASESHYRYPGSNVYPAPLRPLPAPAPLRVAPTAAPPQNHAQAHPAPDDRTEFRMHGMKGPHSYQFGYDTGKGKNRQFRYEERDNDGLVHGHYGYVDRHGKLRVVNYRAHPEHGFQADTQEENKE